MKYEDSKGEMGAMEPIKTSQKHFDYKTNKNIFIYT